MPSRRRIPLIVTLAGVAGAIAAAAGTARADDNLLRGPHPFRKDNQISAHVLVASGRGDSMSGTKLALDYNYKLTSSSWIPLWLDLGFNAQQSGCRGDAKSDSCVSNPSTGNMFETYAGVRWMFATPFPVVPFLGAVTGLAFAFPNGASAGNGFMIRPVGGANYFFFDWLALGAQVGWSFGSLNYDSTFTGSHTYSVLDVGGGLILQF